MWHTNHESEPIHKHQVCSYRQSSRNISDLFWDLHIFRYHRQGLFPHIFLFQNWDFTTEFFFSDVYISRGNRTIPDHIGTYHVNIVHLWWITNLGQARYRLFCTPNFTASETLHVFLNYFRQHDLLVPPVIKLDSPFAWSENYFVCWFQNREYFLVVVVQVVILLHFFKWQDIRNSSLVKSHCPKFRQRLFYNESYWCGVAVDFYIPPPSVTDVL